MRILRHHRNVSPDLRGAVVALGNFDGVHRGHQALIAEARRMAAGLGKSLAAVVFEPQPQEFFRPDAPHFRLTPFRAKAHLLSQQRVDALIVLHFDRALATMSAQDFVLEILKQELAVAHVVVGADFRFGRGRAGDASVLAYMGEMEGFGVTIFEPVADEGSQAKISSTRIREALKAGDPAEAARLLGHWWVAEGHVGAGDGRGKGIGFPTANIGFEYAVEPKFGIYAVAVTVEEKETYDGVASFGIRPMFQVPKPLLEVHLFDFDGELHGKHLAVSFIAYLRPEQDFGSLDALKAQMVKDAEAARAALAAAQVRS
ncbi:MAG: bifunctional riboflavin kinase/FAD synthetase [Alphaproteobacteria bacterium]